MTPWPLPPVTRTTQEIHEFLWERARPTRRIKVNTRHLARDLECSADRAKVLLFRLVAEGRIRVVGRGQYQVPTYLVSDPHGQQTSGPMERVSSWG